MTKTLILGALIVGCVFAAYYPALHGEFFFDDHGYIVGNSIVTGSDGLRRIWLGDGMVDYWPLSFSVFWLEWRLFGQEPLGYHIVNLLLHAATSVILWRILLRFRIHAAWACAALFALHPINSLAAVWVFQTRTTLAACLCGLAVYLCVVSVQERCRWAYAGALLAFVLSLLAKPIAILAPIFWVQLQWGSKQRVTRRWLLQIIPFFAASLMAGALGVWFQIFKSSLSDEFVLQQSLDRRLFDIVRAFGFYLRQALAPTDLMLIHPAWPEQSEDLARLLVSAAAFAGILTLCLYARGAGARQRAGLGAGWFVLGLLPGVGVFHISFFLYAPVSDHYLYLALSGAIVASVELLHAALGRVRLQEHLGAVLVVVGAACLVYTRSRAEVLSSEESVWREVVVKNPQSWLPYYNLGVKAYRMGNSTAAEAYFTAGLERRGQLVEAAYNLGVIAYEAKDFSKAESHLRRAVETRRDFCIARNLLAVVLYREQRRTEALDEWRSVVRICPAFAEAHYNFGVGLAVSGAFLEARQHLLTALDLSPQFAEVRFSAASTFTKHDEARRLLSAVEARANPRQ